MKLDSALLLKLGKDRARDLTVKYIADMVHVAGIRSIVQAGDAALDAALLQGLGIDFLQPAPAAPPLKAAANAS